MFSGFDVASTLTRAESSLRSSVREPTDCPMHRIEIALPAVGPSLMMEVMVLGAFGAQLCQALKRRAAFGCGSSHETPNTSTSLRGKMRNTSAGPEQVGLRGCGRLQRGSLRIDQGNLLETVACQAVRPGEQSKSAP